jgi:hypothetical protein
MISLEVTQLVSVRTIVVGAIALSAPWIPRDRFSRLDAVAGLLAGTAAVCLRRIRVPARFGSKRLAYDAGPFPDP